MHVTHGTVRTLLGKIRILMPVLLLLASSTIGFTEIPEIERKALIALYDATDGPNWINNDGWLGAPGTECDWHGVVCNYTNDVVRGLRLVENGLSGAVPAEIEDFSTLRDLYLQFNQITSLPPELGNLNLSLRYLSLQGNLITSLPSEIEDLETLHTLQLANNDLSSLPQGIGNISSLGRLYVRGNRLLSLPLELTDTSVYDLDIRWNAINPTEPELRAFLDSLHPTRAG